MCFDVINRTMWSDKIWQLQYNHQNPPERPAMQTVATDGELHDWAGRVIERSVLEHLEVRQ